MMDPEKKKGRWRRWWHTLECILKPVWTQTLPLKRQQTVVRAPTIRRRFDPVKVLHSCINNPPANDTWNFFTCTTFHLWPRLKFFEDWGNRYMPPTSLDSGQLLRKMWRIRRPRNKHFPYDHLSLRCEKKIRRYVGEEEKWKSTDAANHTRTTGKEGTWSRSPDHMDLEQHRRQK